MSIYMSFMMGCYVSVGPSKGESVTECVRPLGRRNIIVSVGPIEGRGGSVMECVRLLRRTIIMSVGPSGRGHHGVCGVVRDSCLNHILYPRYVFYRF